MKIGTCDINHFLFYKKNPPKTKKNPENSQESARCCHALKKNIKSYHKTSIHSHDGVADSGTTKQVCQIHHYFNLRNFIHNKP